MASVRNTDWGVSKAHLAAIEAHWPEVRVRRPELRKTIPGLSGSRLKSGLVAGIWMKPTGSRPVRVFSGLTEVDRSTVVLFVRGTTSGMSVEETEHEVVRDMLRDLFHNRRASGLEGELYSRISMGSYDMDDSLERQYDVDLFEITTRFREDRVYPA